MTNCVSNTPFRTQFQQQQCEQQEAIPPDIMDVVASPSVGFLSELYVFACYLHPCVAFHSAKASLYLCLSSTGNNMDLDIDSLLQDNSWRDPVIYASDM